MKLTKLVVSLVGAAFATAAVITTALDAGNDHGVVNGPPDWWCRPELCISISPGGTPKNCERVCAHDAQCDGCDCHELTQPAQSPSSQAESSPTLLASDGSLQARNDTCPPCHFDWDRCRSFYCPHGSLSYGQCTEMCLRMMNDECHCHPNATVAALPSPLEAKALEITNPEVLSPLSLRDTEADDKCKPCLDDIESCLSICKSGSCRQGCVISSCISGCPECQSGGACGERCAEPVHGTKTTTLKTTAGISAAPDTQLAQYKPRRQDGENVPAKCTPCKSFFAACVSTTNCAVNNFTCLRVCETRTCAAVGAQCPAGCHLGFGMTLDECRNSIPSHSPVPLPKLSPRAAPSSSTPHFPILPTTTPQPTTLPLALAIKEHDTCTPCKDYYQDCLRRCPPAINIPCFQVCRDITCNQMRGKCDWGCRVFPGFSMNDCH
ncbi:hypothetical protein CC80DRAFT_598812 [Byssothecium circinans]|uniref:Uncharacterized protein n=1 Tax=Byssothecium circinans TaxID=147558 RepID=A0A6A5TA82_9PLEO|nr:hypothetical protein CC80DRAFT_598812 [Byssothecium circinans]